MAEAYEAVPSQETEAMPPMKEPSGGKPPRKKLPLKAKVAIGVGCALVVAGVGCGVAFSMQQAPEAPDQPAAEQQEAAQKQTAKFKVDMGEWDADGATPLIAHITGGGADFYAMVDSKGECSVELEPGDYMVEFVPAIGKDGSLLQVAGASRLSVGDSPADGFSFTAKAAAKAAQDAAADDIAAAVDGISAAVKKGDSSLKGEAGRKLLETAKANAAANPNMDDAAKAEAEAKADEAEASADEAPAESAGSSAASSSGSASGNSSGGSGSSSSGSASSAQAPASSGGSSSGSGSSGSSSSSSQPSQPAHVHNWVAVTSQQWHSNPVKVWVQDSAAWDEQQVEGHYFCAICGDVGTDWKHVTNGPGHSLSARDVVVGTIHHDATGHYETQDQGWYETVTTGYQCSGCGAWQ